MEESAEKQLGSYRILQRLEGGSPGELFLAEHLCLGGRRILRVIPRTLLDEAAAYRLVRQLHALALLDHPNLVRVLDAGQSKDSFFIATEQLDAIPAGAVAPAQALTWAIQAASVLEHLHEHGIIHEDLRPANILIDAGGSLRIDGAGLAGILQTRAAEAEIDAMVSQVVARSRGESESATAPAAMEHLAPELRAGSKPSARTDLYAMGILFWRLLCGREQARIKQPPSQLVRGLDSRWDAILARCTAQSPHGRYPSASALLADLQRMRKPAMRRPVAAAIGGVAVCAIAAAAILWGPWPARPGSVATTRPHAVQREAPTAGISSQVIPTTAPAITPAFAHLAASRAWAAKAMELAHNHPPDAEASALLKRAAAVLREGTEMEGASANADAILRYEHVIEICDAVEAVHARNRARMTEAATRALASLNRQIDDYGRDRLIRYGGETWETLRDALPRADDGPADIIAAVEEASQILAPATQAADRAWRAEQAVLVQRQVAACAAVVRAMIQQQRIDEAQQQLAQGLALRADAPELLEVQRLLRPHLLPKEFTLDVEPGCAMTLLRITPGTFIMGSPRRPGAMAQDDTAHEVTLTRGFYMGRTEVTRRQFLAFARGEGYRTEAERDGWADALYNPRGGVPGRVNNLSWRNPGFEQQQLDSPVVCVTWNDAQAYCAWLSRKSGRVLRLPTEAEWEYACRAGTRTQWSWGDDEAIGKEHANILDLAAGEQLKLNGADWRDGHVFTAPVGGYKPNAFGLHDMHGNISEWCIDVYGPYANGPVVDPTASDSFLPGVRVIRGGSWFQLPFASASAYRAKALQAHRNSCLGFRIVMEVADDEPATRPATRPRN